MTIKARIIEKGTDGRWFSTNTVTMVFKDMDGRDLVFFMEPKGLYQIVYSGISRMSQTKTDDTTNMPAEMRTLKEQLVRVVRGAVKGILLMYGDKMLTMFYGTKEHPRPPKDKHLDLVDWYMDQFTQIAIAHMMYNDIVLVGEHVKGDTGVISVDTVFTRPVAPNVEEPGDRHNEAEQSEQRPGT